LIARLDLNLTDYSLRSDAGRTPQIRVRDESEGDHRGSIVALREVRECLESLGAMMEKANEVSGGPSERDQYDLSVLSDDELRVLEALLAKAAPRAKGKA